MDLTRSERLNCFLVTYGSNSAKKVASKPSPSVKGSSKQSTPRAKKVATPAASPSVVASQSNQKPRRTPGPASRTGLKASPSRATGGQLPAGWRIRDRQEGGQTYISPEGREFQVCTQHLHIKLNVFLYLPGQIRSYALRCLECESRQQQRCSISC